MPQNKQETTSIRRHRPIYKLPLFWIILILVLGIGGFVGYKVLAKEKPKESQTSQTETKEKTNSKTNEKTNQPSTEKSDDTKETNTSDSSSASPDGKTPEKYDGDDPNLEESLTGAITTARFNDDILIIRVTIDQYLSNGTCTLNLSSGDESLQRTANIAPIAASSSCEGFDIPIQELSSLGDTINIKINISSGNKTGNINGEVER